MGILPLIRLVRPHQWVKNLLVLAPLFFSTQLSPESIAAAVGAVLVFIGLASSAYCLNDVIDAKMDRVHPVKRGRPVASGAISERLALTIGSLLFLGAVAGAAALGEHFFYVALLYTVLQIGYTTSAKHIAILDLMILAMLYLVRVLGGAAATGVEPSPWILICTWLVALLLASGKRYTELTRYESLELGTRPVLTAYSANFLEHLLPSTAAMVLMSYLLWCSESVERGRFGAIAMFPGALFVTYGVLRYLLRVLSNSFDEDPTSGLLRDRPLLITIVLYTGWMGLVLYVH